MIMIAFIQVTIKRGLAALLEGLCAQMYYFRFEIIGGLRSHLFLFFFERKTMSRFGKKQLVQDLIQPPSIYIHMYSCSLYTYTNTYMPRFSPSGFVGPSRCLIPTPGLTSKYPICAVCVCVCIHTPTPTYSPTRVKNREDTDNTPISPSVKKNRDPPRQATSALRLAGPPHPRFPKLNEQTAHTRHQRICTPCSGRVRKCVR